MFLRSYVRVARDFLLAATQVFCQGAVSTLSGKIATTTGAPISNVVLSIRNTANGETKNLTANPDGSFVLQNLSQGTYEITASAARFAATKMQITILVGQDQTANITLQAETGAADERQPGTSGVSEVVSSKSVTDLPLNGRSASDLATLEPGVASARTQPSGTLP